MEIEACNILNGISERCLSLPAWWQPPVHLEQSHRCAAVWRSAGIGRIRLMTWSLKWWSHNWSSNAGIQHWAPGLYDCQSEVSQHWKMPWIYEHTVIMVRSLWMIIIGQMASVFQNMPRLTLAAIVDERKRAYFWWQWKKNHNSLLDCMRDSKHN